MEHLGGPEGSPYTRKPLSPEDQIRLDALLQRSRVERRPGDSKRHHFIPQFFQRRFANAESQLLVVPLDGSKRRICGVQDIAVVADFYTSIDDDVGENVGFETILGDLDSTAAAVLRDFVDRDQHLLNSNDHQTLSLWLSILHVRDPRTRRTLEALGDQVFKLDLLSKRSPDRIRKQFLHNVGREPTDGEVNEYIELATSLNDIEVTPHQNSLIVTMFDAALWSLPLYTNRSVKLYRFRQPGLVLSDRPVILKSTDTKLDEGIGLANADQIIVPIDRQAALVLGTLGTTGCGVITTSDELLLRQINQYVVGNAINEVYCNSADETQLDGLEFPDPNRPLFTISADDAVLTNTDGVNAAPIRKSPRRFRRPEESEPQTYAPDASD